MECIITATYSKYYDEGKKQNVISSIFSNYRAIEFFSFVDDIGFLFWVDTVEILHCSNPAK